MCGSHFSKLDQRCPGVSGSIETPHKCVALLVILCHNSFCHSTPFWLQNGLFPLWFDCMWQNHWSMWAASYYVRSSLFKDWSSMPWGRMLICWKTSSVCSTCCHIVPQLFLPFYPPFRLWCDLWLCVAKPQIYVSYVSSSYLKAWSSMPWCMLIP